MDDKIKQIQNNFGGQLDRDVLTEILEMFGGDARAATQFLQADNGGGGGQAMTFQELQAQAEDGMPKNYPKQGPKTLAELANRNQLSSDKESPLDKIVRILSSETTTMEHCEMQAKHYSIYLAVVLVQSQNRVEFTKVARPRMLAAALARRDYELSDFLLQNKELFGLHEVLKACKLLDAEREIKQLERQLTRLRSIDTVKSTTKANLRAKIALLKQDVAPASLSGALKRRLAKWVKNTFSCADFEWFAMGMPTAPWRSLCNLLHLSSNDFASPWFHSFIYGTLPDSSSVVCRFNKLFPPSLKALKASVNEDDFEENDHNNRSVSSSNNDLVQFIDSDRVPLLCQMNVPYAALRSRVNTGALQRVVRAHISSYEQLSTILWFYEELECEATDKEIVKRLENGQGNALTFGYGKLMERATVVSEKVRPLLLMEAQRRLNAIALPLESPCVVLGDASDSMAVAIRCATFVAAGAACLADAELRFFNDKSWKPNLLANDVKEVFNTAMTTKAKGLTCCAVALHEFYVNKVFVNCFVLVSDEIDNVAFGDQYFPTLFAKYRDEVNPNCKIALISFRDDPLKLGRVHSALLALDIAPCAVVALSAIRPDAARIDGLLATLATGSAAWQEMVLDIAGSIDVQLKRVQSTAQSDPMGAAVAGQQNNAIVVEMTKKTGEKVEKEADDNVKSVSSSSSSLQSFKKLLSHNCIECGSDALTVYLKRRGYSKLAAGNVPTVKKSANNADDNQDDDDDENNAALIAARAQRNEVGVKHECIVCEDAESDTALLECGHFGFCAKCAELLMNCPLCRQRVSRRVRIYKQ